jgi:hypothetical protein
MVAVVSRSVGLLREGAVGLRTLWVDAVTAFRSLAGPVMRQRPRLHASGVSGEWLRCNAIESAKHVDDR